MPGPAEVDPNRQMHTYRQHTLSFICHSDSKLKTPWLVLLAYADMSALKMPEESKSNTAAACLPVVIIFALLTSQ